jgi:hypothetical protein
VAEGLKRARAAARATRPPTPNEWKFLMALPRGGGLAWATPGSLMAGGKLPSDSSPQGLHQTGSSLVRKGLAEKDTGRHPVGYRLTPAGRTAVTERAAQSSRDAAVFVRRAAATGHPRSGGNPR